MHLSQGTSLCGGRYLIKSCIGDGGFGITYVADDTRLSREIVIKEYFPDYMAKRDITVSNDVQTIDDEKTEDLHTGISKFLNEAKTLALLNRIPAIASVYDYFEENNTAYIVMEYIHGKNLKEHIRERKVPYSYEEAMTILAPCMYALQKVHEAGIIHRDFAPDNIIIDDRGQVKIIDFGASREYIGGNATMTIMVKHGYAPAEQYSNAVKQGPYTDVYSIAAILYEMVTLTKPVTSIDRVFADTLIEPRKINPYITEEQEAVMLKGLSVIFSSRYQTVDEFSNALKSVWGRISSLDAINENEAKTEIIAEPVKAVNAASEESNIKARKKSKGLKILLAVVACGTAAALALLAFVLYKDPVTKYVEYFEAGDYGKANKIYSEKIAGNTESEDSAYEYLDNYLNEIWNGYADGIVSEEELEKALEKLHKVKGIDKIQSEITKTEEKLQLIKESQIAFDSGKEKQEAGEYLAAIEEYNKVSKDDPLNYDEAQKAIAEIKETYANNLVNEAKDKIADGEYAEAVKILSEVSHYFENDSEIQSLMKQATTLEFEETLKGYINNNEFIEAKSCYENALNNSYCEISDKIKVEYNSYVESVRKSYLTNCREVYRTTGYLQAMEVIREGLKLFHDDTAMKGYEELLIKSEPVSLKSLTPMDDAGYKPDRKEVTDKYNITYSDCIAIDTADVTDEEKARKSVYGAYVKYLVDGEYTTLSFKMVNAARESSITLCCRVVADNETIYTSDYFSNQDKAIDVKVDISNAETIEINANHHSRTFYGDLIIADAYIYREITDEEFDAVE